MPRLSQSVPKYRKHRASGQAIVSIAGKDHNLGPHGSKASELEYDRKIQEWLANGRTIPEKEADTSVSVVEVLAAYHRYAKGYYIKDGKPTTEQYLVRYVIREVKRLYGREPAANFGPLALKAIRQGWIDASHTRTTINSNVQRINRIFRCAASEELIPVAVHQALKTVQGLTASRSKAKETEKIKPVDLARVDATLPHLLPVVADMVRLQLLCGMRPQEVCKLRPSDLDRSGDIWEYSVDGHKTEHRGRQRIVYIGPAARAILRPYLLRAFDRNCFSPREAVQQQREQKHLKRKTPLSCGNRPGSKTKRSPKRLARDEYDKNSYWRAVRRACERAFPHSDKLEGNELVKWKAENYWHPNQLRHTKATEIRKQFGLEAAQVILGHAAADVTQIYAERDAEKAREVARKIG